MKAPCSPQTVGSGDEELVDEAVVALNEVMELAEALELEVGSEALLIKVVNVRIDEFGVGDVEDDEVGAIDSVHVSSARDAELAELGTTEVVEIEVFIDVDLAAIAEDAPDKEPELIAKLKEEREDEVEKPEEVVLAGLALDVILLWAELATVGEKEVVEVEVIVVVVVVVDVDADELGEESCDEEAAVETELKEERVDAEKSEEVD